MAMKMMIKAMENQINMVLNLSLSVDCRFASAEPIVMKTIEVSIKTI